MVAALTEDQEHVCDMGTAAGQRLFVPAYNSPDFLQKSSAWFGQQASSSSTQKQQAASIQLVDPAQPGLPLGGGVYQDLIVGQTYLLQLTGFPPRSLLSVAVLDATTNKEAATVQLTIDSVGAAEKEWSVPSTFLPGDYYLQVTRGSNVLGIGLFLHVCGGQVTAHEAKKAFVWTNVGGVKEEKGGEEQEERWIERRSQLYM